MKILTPHAVLRTSNRTHLLPIRDGRPYSVFEVLHPGDVWTIYGGGQKHAEWVWDGDSWAPAPELEDLL